MGGLRFLLFFVLLGAYSHAAVRTLDLKSAIQYSLENSPRFDSLKRERDISVLNKKNAKAQWFPSLDLKATHGLQEEDPRLESTPWESELSLTLTENLYDNGVTSTNYRIATLNEDIAELQYNDQRNAFSLELANAYLSYSLSIKLLEIQEKQFKLISKQSELTTRQYRNGMRTKKDYLRFKTQVSRAEIDLIAARSEVEKSKESILSLIGIGLRPVEAVTFVPVSLEGLKDDLTPPIELENHLLFQAAQKQKKVNELTSDLTRRKQYPELFLTAGATYGSRYYIDTGRNFDDNETSSWGMLLTVRYNFLDWGIRSRDAEIASQRAIILNNELDSRLLTLRTNLNKLKIDNSLTQRNFRLAGELFEMEKENLSLIDREYRNGNVSYLDFITGLSDFADAERKFYSASRDLISARYSLLYHQGKLYEELLK